MINVQDSVARVKSIADQALTLAYHNTMKMNTNDDGLVPPPPNDGIVDDSDNESEAVGFIGGDSDADSNASTRASEVTPKLAKRESRDVFRLRLAVLLVLVSSAVGAALAVHFYLANSEEQQFMGQFDEDAEKVLDAIGRSIDQTMAAFDSMAVTLVSTAQMTNQSWPFVTIADYAVRMSKVIPLTHAVLTYSYHVVKPDQRAQWEEYTTNNNGWVNESMAVQKEWGGYYGPIEYNGDQSDAIYGVFDDLPANTRCVRRTAMLESPQSY
jgi:hypothetical protein